MHVKKANPEHSTRVKEKEGQMPILLFETNRKKQSITSPNKLATKNMIKREDHFSGFQLFTTSIMSASSLKQKQRQLDIGA